MDLAKILSPAVEEEPPRREEQREEGKWSVDEMQCAVSILHDFQQPLHHTNTFVERGGGGGEYSRDHHRYVGQYEHQYRNEMEFEHKQEESEADEEEVEQREDTNLSSKLDLLVQADAIIKDHNVTSSRASTTTSSQQPQAYLRSGVWTPAEEEYAAALIYYFLKGALAIQDGTTLRKFLAERLCCNRRRVSMKLATETIANKQIPRKVGASVFVARYPPPSEEEREEMENLLDELRRQCFETANYSSEPSETLDRQRRVHKELQEILHKRPQVELGSSEIKLKVIKREPPHVDDNNRHHYGSSIISRQSESKLKSPEPGKRKKPTIIRTGFDSLEEERYVTAMFEYFTAGLLDIPDGTKLVAYLCEKLQCTPKALSMKLAPRRLGERKFPDNVGTMTYIRKPAKSSSQADLAEVEKRLQELNVACRDPTNTTPTSPVKGPIICEQKYNLNSTPSNTSSPTRSFSRSGPWSREEEVYSAALIEFFFKGVLDIAEGTTLRAFLASRLCCNPMRISKKLASEWIADTKIPKKLGSSTFTRRASVTAEEQAACEKVLHNLQRAYLHSESIKDDIVAGMKHPRAEEPEQEDYVDDGKRLSSRNVKSPPKLRKMVSGYKSPPYSRGSRRRHHHEKSPSSASSSPSSSRDVYECVVPLPYQPVATGG